MTEPSSACSASSEMRWEAFRKHRRETEPQLLKPSLKETANSETAVENSNQLQAAESRRSLPLELLAGEWLEQQPCEATYVTDRLLPTLVLGMEQLLTEVSERGLEDSEVSQYDFNPLNLLGQYLMRNNPLHSALPPNHPYCNQLRQVSEQLKKASH